MCGAELPVEEWREGGDAGEKERLVLSEGTSKTGTRQLVPAEGISIGAHYVGSRQFGTGDGREASYVPGRWRQPDSFARRRYRNGCAAGFEGRGLVVEQP